MEVLVHMQRCELLITGYLIMRESFTCVHFRFLLVSDTHGLVEYYKDSECLQVRTWPTNGRPSSAVPVVAAQDVRMWQLRFAVALKPDSRVAKAGKKLKTVFD